MMYMPLMFADEAKAPQTSKKYQAAAQAWYGFKAAASRWAEKSPTAKHGSIEVRPLNQWSQKA